MKVYHITEAPRIEPPVGGLGDRPINRGPIVNSGGGNAPRLTSVDITDTGILDRNGNKIFKVVDQDGKELFRGNEAAANAERDKLSRNIRPAATPAANNRANTITPDADEVKPASDGKKSNLVKRFSKGALEKSLVYGKTIFGGTIVGLAIKAYQITSIVDKINLYDEQIDEAVRLYNDNGRRATPRSRELTDLNKALVLDIIDSSTDYLFTSAGAGLAVTVAAGGLMIPGAGWVVALLVGAAAAAGGAAGMLLLAKKLPARFAFDSMSATDPDASLYEEVRARIARVIRDDIQDKVNGDGASFWAEVIGSKAYPAILNLQAIQLPGIPASPLSGIDRVRRMLDSITYEDNDAETEDTSISDLKQFVLKDPKLKKLVVQGAEETKRLRSNGPR